MNKFWGILTLIFVGFIVMGVILNATNFSKAAGTLFSGTASLGKVLEGQGLWPLILGE